MRPPDSPRESEALSDAAGADQERAAPGTSRGPTIIVEIVSTLSLLTTLRIPRHFKRFVSYSAVARALFPAVGLVLGALAWLCFWVGSSTIGPSAGAFLAVAALVALSGALHLDGLGDAADGLLGGSDRERRLTIMRDSRVGSFGAVAIVLALLGDVIALSGQSRHHALAALLGSAALGRMAMLVVVVGLPYARADGLGDLVSGNHAIRDLLLAAPFASLPLLLDWRHWLIALGVAGIACAGFAAFAKRLLGGATGDIYGATCELTQLAALLAYAVRL